PGGVLAVLGLGPVVQFVARIGLHLGHRVIGVDPVAERRTMAARHGVEVVDPIDLDVPAALKDLTGGWGPDSVVDAVGMEAHGGAPGVIGKAAQAMAGLLPDAASRKLIETAGIDRLTALQDAF